MNLKNLKYILNQDIEDNIKEYLFIQALATEKSLIPDLLKILNQERKFNEKLITDMNLELSRAHVYIDMHEEKQKKSKMSFNKSFVIDEIAKFYIKYKGVIIHCFNRFN